MWLIIDISNILATTAALANQSFDLCSARVSLDEHRLCRQGPQLRRN